MSVALLGLLAVPTVVDEPRTVADRIVAFASSRLGETVGDGECTDLVAAALRDSGAAGDRGRPSGAPVESLEHLAPGDILVFEGAEFRGRMRDGRGMRRWRLSFEDHVAIVARAEVRPEGVLVSIFHQNFRDQDQDPGDGRVVQEMTLQLGRLTAGRIRGVRPASTDRTDVDARIDPSDSAP